MPVTAEERKLLEPMFEVYRAVDPSVSQSEIENSVEELLNRNSHFAANPFEDKSVLKDFEENMLPISRKSINPNGVNKEQTVNWFVNFFTFGRGQMIGNGAPPPSPVQTPMFKTINCNMVPEMASLPKGGPKFSPGSNGGFVASLTTFLGGIATATLIGAAIGFFTVVLKRAFPLHHIQIDRLMKCIKIGIAVVGIIGIIAMFFTGGIAAVPIIIALVICSMIAAYFAEKISTIVTEFLCDLKVSLFNWLSDLAERAGLPIGVVEFLRSVYSHTMRVHVGLCTRCGLKPRNVISINCGHMVYCVDCQPSATHCDCGEIMSADVYLFADPQMSECECKGCVPVIFCGSCGVDGQFSNKVATVFHVYRNGKMSLRCKSCIDKNAKYKIYVPHRKEVCEPVIVSASDPTPSSE